MNDQDSNTSRLFVGNLPFSATPEDLRKFLTPAGKVRWVHILAQDGRSRGFAFVEMRNNIDAQIAIFRFDGPELQGRQLTNYCLCQIEKSESRLVEIPSAIKPVVREVGPVTPYSLAVTQIVGSASPRSARFLSELQTCCRITLSHPSCWCPALLREMASAF